MKEANENLVDGNSEEQQLPRRKFYVFEPKLMQRSFRVRLVPGEVKKHPKNPLLVQDRPWEVSMDNVYPNVHYDEELGKYRCWYSVFLEDPMKEYYGRYHEAPREAFRGRVNGLCYAESADGVVWHKPNLGLVEYEGNVQNNIVLRGYHGAGVLRLPEGVNGPGRYTMVANRQGVGMFTAQSTDGFIWGDWRRIAVPKIAGQMHNNIFWNAEDRTGFLMTRIKTVHGKRWKAVHGRHAMSRRLGVCSTEDFETWSDLGTAMSGAYTAQPYSLVVYPLDTGYLGFLAVIDEVTGIVTSELAYSLTGRNWRRLLPEHLFIPNGTGYDKRCIFPGLLVNQGKEDWIYYGASEFRHTEDRKGGMALATIRRDRFIAVEPVKASEFGRFQTTSIFWTPITKLRVNVKINQGGYLRCEVVRGRRAATSSALLGRGGLDVLMRFITAPVEKAESVCLRFELFRAALYTFSVSENG